MDCNCCISPRRRRMLATMGALAAGLASGVPASATAAPTATTAATNRATVAPKGMGKSIDIHAHYYPESFCDLLGSEGAKFGGKFTCDATSFTFQTPAGGLGPLPLKFINVDERLADMNASGVDVQALSLSVPMAYWADRAFNAKLARTWNAAASAIHARLRDQRCAQSSPASVQR
ncbi:MAG: hypothetical protein ACJ8HC_21385 [Paraburkholderia graminis]|uniref:hypothetical protein n=1 Tax=Paraburkholderia graminis TaxID=60548 RepID=UPI00389A6C86